MMNAKKIVGFLLVGCFLLSDGVLNAAAARRRAAEQAQASRGGNSGNQNVTPPPPLNDPAPDFGPDFTDRIAKVDSEEAAVALALEILEYLAKPGVLNFNEQQIDDSRKWGNFIGSVNEKKAQLHGRQWKLKDASCVLVEAK